MKPILNMDTLEPKGALSRTEEGKLFKKIERAIMYGATLEQVADDNSIAKNTVINVLARHDTSVNQIRGRRPNWRKIKAEKERQAKDAKRKD